MNISDEDQLAFSRLLATLVVQPSGEYFPVGDDRKASLQRTTDS